MKGAVSDRLSAVGVRLRFPALMPSGFDDGAVVRCRDRSSMRDFRTLRVWQHAHALTVSVYQATTRFPKDELYGLRSQIRRAASSIGANLAEASGRRHDADQARLCQISMGSACELEYHLLLAHDLGYIDDATWARLVPALESVKRMLTMFIRKLTGEGRQPTADGRQRFHA